MANDGELALQLFLTEFVLVLLPRRPLVSQSIPLTGK